MGKKQLSTDKQNSTESIINPELYNKLRQADSKISKNIYKMPDQKWHHGISKVIMKNMIPLLNQEYAL